MRRFWLGVLLLAGFASANGILVPDVPGFPVRLGTHRVEAVIRDRVATVSVEQTFHSTAQRQLEGVYLFPLPRGALVRDFAMTMGDRMVKGEILDASKARAIYESIVRKRRDPGLLEYLGRGLFRASVFPIEPGGALTIRLTYEQVLPEATGTVEFSYPLASDGMNGARVAEIVVDVRYESAVPLKTVLCTSHDAEVIRKGEREARVTVERKGLRQDGDFLVHFGRSEEDLGFTLLSHKPPAEDGTFLAVLAPRLEVDESEIVPKDVLYVLDTSGSMSGDKLEQAQRSLRFAIGLLRPVDRFNVITFATDTTRFRPRLVPADEESKRAAIGWIGTREAAGATALDLALAEAVAQGDAERLFAVVLLTDGRPTAGERDPERILANLTAANAARARIFTFGVGNDLDVRLLDRIAEATGGERDYIAPHEEIGLVTNRFFRKIDRPVLTDLVLEYPDGVDRTYPRRLPDLFAGGQVVVLGRYREGGGGTFRLRARRNGSEVVFEHRGTLASGEDAVFLPRLWAQRKIAFLLDEMRLHGEHPELRDEVVSLARRHFIVTPYTAALVLEDGTRRVDSRSPIFFSSKGAASGPTTPGGGGGPPPGLREPSDSKDLRRRKEATAIEDDRVIQVAADKAFRQDAEGRWVDTSWDGEGEPVEVTAFSEEYFALLRRSDKVAKYLAVGERVLLLLDGILFEIVSPS